MFEKTIHFFQRRKSRRNFEKRGLVGAGRRRGGEDSELARAADRSLVLGCFMLVLIWGVCSLLLSLASSNRVELEMPVLGQTASQTIQAAFDFSFPDKEATEAARREAINGEPRFYNISEAENQRIKQNFDDFREAVRFRATPNAPDVRKPSADSVGSRAAAMLNPAAVKAFDQCMRNPSAYRYVENELNEIYNAGVLGSGIQTSLKNFQQLRVIDPQQREKLPRPVKTQPNENTAATALADAILKFQSGNNERAALIQQYVPALKLLLGSDGNLTFNATRTAAAEKIAVDKVGVVHSEVKRHQPIVRKGQQVDENTLSKLNLYLRNRDAHEAEVTDWRLSVRNMFWSFTLVILAGFYLYHIHPEVVSSNRRIGIVGSVVLISLVCNYGGIELFSLMARESASLPRTLLVDTVPLALVAVVMAAFLGFRVAMCAGFFVASITALMLDMSFEFALKGILICSLAALAVRNATNYRSYFLRTVFTVFPLIWLLNSNIYGAATSFQEVTKLVIVSAGLALANGFATAIIALLMVFTYEIVINVSTNMSLMVLCDYNHPLLERLKREAPGTFFHSLMVATLSEDAARAIHANYLKAKAGALFHDIGKLAKPQYFTENNLDMANQHTELTPQMSSMIIRDHVSEGIELAREYKLNRVVRDAIEQHHGNDLVHYFYNQAVDQGKKSGDTVPESQFRYHGTPPLSKETAIISLADACEAACRSLDKPSASRIEALVDAIFLKRFHDGQLINADMTLAELEKVRESFINTLLSMKHGRIAYHPEKPRNDGDKDDEDDLFVAAGKQNQAKS